MAGGLAEWDRVIQAFEAHVASELPAASSRSPFGCERRIWPEVRERGRLADALRELDAASRLEPHAHLSVASRAAARRVARTTGCRRGVSRAWAGRGAIRSRPTTCSALPRQGIRDPGFGTRDSSIKRASRAHVKPCRRPIARLSTAARTRSLSPSQASIFFKGSGEVPVIPPVVYAQGYALHRSRRVRRGDRRIPKGSRDRSTGDRSGRTIGVDDASGRRAQTGTHRRRALAARARRRPWRFVGGASRAGTDLLGGRSQHDKSIEQLEIADAEEPARRTIAPGAVARPERRRTRPGRTTALQETIQVLPDSALARGGLARAFKVSIDLRTHARNSNGRPA